MQSKDMRDMERRRSMISKRALLEQALRARSSHLHTQGTLTIPRRSTQDPVVLSFSQQRLWMIEQLYPGNGAYTLAQCLHLFGPLDREALQRSLHAVVQRHEILRTTFKLVAGQPRQCISTAENWDLPVYELSNVSIAEQEQQIQRQIRAQLQNPVDLMAGPLFQPVFFCLAPEKHILSLCAHHIIWDGWSWTIFLRELSAFYRAYHAHEPITLAALPLQYADYALWQREWLQGAVLDTHLAYWKHKLAGIPTVLELPSDYARPTTQTFAGSISVFEISHKLVTSIQTLSRQANATPFMAFLAAFAILIARYTGQDCFLLGSPSSGRIRTELESLVGCFINTLVLKMDLSSNPTFRELLARVREVCLEAYEHQELPFERIVEELQPERDPSYSPLVQVFFALQNTPQQKLHISDVQTRMSSFPIETTRADLTLDLWEQTEGMQGTIEYNTNLFTQERMQQLSRHYCRLLEEVVADADRSIWHLPFLSSVEIHQLVVEWNATQAAVDETLCIHQLFEQQVQRTPEAVALVYEGQQLTYAALNERANQLARYLQRRGVGPEVLIGVCLQRSLDMVISLLAILKAGGAYVPLDPTHPLERLRYILNETHMPFLLVHQQLLTSLPESRPTVLCLDQEWDAIAQESTTPLETSLVADNLAYVIYTSGSTGRPKGVQIQHCNVVNFLFAMQHILHLTPQDVLGSVTTLSFDIAGLEIYLPLVVGACVAIAPQRILADGTELGSFLHQAGVTVLQATPITWRLLLGAKVTLPAGMKKLCGGEALSSELASRLLEHTGEFWNLYGPTETTIWSMAYQLPHTMQEAISIGRPIANTQIFVLDRQLQLVPIGVAGELYIGGEGLARGYLNRPEMTAERFIPNPFSARPGAQMYATGDLVRFRGQGDIEYLGRIDHQVKIRGFRIELGEIEALLHQYPGVAESVVVAHEEKEGNKQLIAYIVPEAKQDVPLDHLRGALMNQLPAYMIPSAIVALQALPRTPNGKIDRKALPIPSRDGKARRHYVAPRTEVEKILAGMWAEVLTIEGIGIYEDFFASGGHSLHIIQLISLIQHAFGIDMKVRTFLKTPCIAGLAEHVEQARRARQGVSQNPIIRLPRQQFLPISAAQHQRWFLNQQPRAASLPPRILAMSYHLRGQLNTVVLEQSVNEVIRRHENLRTVFREVDGCPQALVIPSLTISLNRIDLSTHAKDDQMRAALNLIDEEMVRRFDWEYGPLIRSTLVQFGENEYIFSILLDHMIADGWSTTVVEKELAALYDAFVQGETSPLSELPIQFADYVDWHQKRLQSNLYSTLRSYWARQLLDCPCFPALELLPARPLPAQKNSYGVTESFFIAPSLSTVLKKLAQSRQVSRFMLMLAILKTLIYHYTGLQDIGIVSPNANRDTLETAALIGWFASNMFLRTNLSGDPTFLELLERVRETLLDAYDHQGMTFPEILHALNVAWPKEAASIPQIFLDYVEPSQLRLHGIEVSGLAQGLKSANAGISLWIIEQGEQFKIDALYQADRYEAAAVRGLLQYFSAIIERVAANPQRRLSQLSPFGAEQEKK